MKTTTHTLRNLKGQRPLVAVTAYDAIMARLASDAGVDLILVGDSVGNTMLGFRHTVPVTVDMIAHHAAAVMRTEPSPLVVADIPFAEAHYDFERLLATCQRLMQQSGVEAVKIEGGVNVADKIARLVEAGVPVMGHIGLQPQQVFALGKYRKFGVKPSEAEQLIEDALSLEKAGVFSIVGEMIEHNLARTISETLKVPLVGIGSGVGCDGQILVSTDILGMTQGNVPSFARAFAQVGTEMKKGFAAYTEAVRSRAFPG